MPADGAELRRRLGAPAELENVIGALVELGVPEDAISDAYERGRIEDAIFDPVLETTRERRTVTPVEIERDGRPAVAETQPFSLNRIRAARATANAPGARGRTSRHRGYRGV